MGDNMLDKIKGILFLSLSLPPFRGTGGKKHPVENHCWGRRRWVEVINDTTPASCLPNRYIGSSVFDKNADGDFFFFLKGGGLPSSTTFSTTTTLTNASQKRGLYPFWEKSVEMRIECNKNYDK